MLKFNVILTILLFSVNIYCQNNEMTNSKNTLEVRYDIEGIKLVEIMRIDGEVKYAHYFSRQGDTISVHNWRINLSATDRVKAKIKENFIVNDLTYTRSMASLLLILDFENNIFEIRIEGGINQDFNKELLRVIKEIEKDLIFICTTDCQMPIVTPFPLWIIDRQ